MKHNYQKVSDIEANYDYDDHYDNDYYDKFHRKDQSYKRVVMFSTMFVVMIFCIYLIKDFTESSSFDVTKTEKKLCLCEVSASDFLPEAEKLGILDELLDETCDEHNALLNRIVDIEDFLENHYFLVLKDIEDIEYEDDEDDDIEYDDDIEAGDLIEEIDNE